ncbi:MAG: prolipoprotein diacylglyceryl transferase [Flavobacteriales bacterium]|nr:prolipoprotein diacylglyceryl transferase [Flavobacteriales bacterium]
MYPTLYHALFDVTGLEWCFLKFLNSFGFFVALAFIAASWTLALELKRREGIGQLRSRSATALVGVPVSNADLISTGFFGFILGWKGLPILLDSCRVTDDAPGFLLSLQGNWIAGVLVAAASVGYAWWKGKKNTLAEPKEETVQVHPYQLVGRITITAALWGMIGAKVFHWLENPDDFMRFISEPSAEGFITGLTMYGGLIIAGIMVIRFFKKNDMAILPSMDSAAPGLMLAYAIGRIGCQVSGDGDWGIINSAYVSNGNGTVAEAPLGDVKDRIELNAAYYERHFGSVESVPMAAYQAPSWLPTWMVAYSYPNNVNGVGGNMIMGGPCFPDHNADGQFKYCTFLDPPVYPTPLYETIASTLLFAVLWLVRKRIAVPGVLFCLYLMLNGFERFWIEKIRVNVPVLGSITQAEIIATLLFLIGLGGWIWLKRKNNHATPSPTN